MRLSECVGRDFCIPPNRRFFSEPQFAYALVSALESNLLGWRYCIGLQRTVAFEVPPCPFILFPSLSLPYLLILLRSFYDCKIWMAFWLNAGLLGHGKIARYWKCDQWGYSAAEDTAFGVYLVFGSFFLSLFFFRFFLIGKCEIELLELLL